MVSIILHRFVGIEPGTEDYRRKFFSSVIRRMPFSLMLFPSVGRVMLRPGKGFCLMTDDFISLLKRIATDVREGEPIGPHTTVQVGGPCRAMVFPHGIDELRAILSVLREATPSVSWEILGKGANAFGDSDGYSGIVISMVEWEESFEIGDKGVLAVSGGASMRDVAIEAARRGWGGIDFMAVVPGTIGGAVVINAGTNREGFVADRLLWVETLDLAGNLARHTPETLEMGYRTTRLLGAGLIVVRAAFGLVSCSDAGIAPELLFERFDAAMRERETKFPLDLPNFGSTFRSAGPPHPPTGKMIDDMGMRGLRIGNAQISPRHGNFLVNLGGATSSDILGLMQRMYDAVLDRYDVRLHAEVRYIADRSKPRPAFID
jgi:UDP-N-acetylmuramate dehydrogenase